MTRRLPALPLLGGLAVVLLALLGLVVTGVALPAPGPTGVPQDDAVASARQVAVDVTSFDYRKLDEEVGAVERSATGDFLGELQRSRGALVAQLTKEHRVSTSRVLQAALASPGQSEAVVLVAIDETRSTDKQKDVAIRYRLQLRMQHRSGHWLLAELRPVA